MKIKSLVLILTYSLISLLAPVLLACDPPPPDCGTCSFWNGSECEWIGCMANGGNCPDCYYCDSIYTCECQCGVDMDWLLAEPTNACPGDEIEFNLLGSPLIENCVLWSAPGGDPSSQEGGMQFWTSWDEPGEKTVTVVSICSSVHEQTTVYIGEPCPGVPGGCCVVVNEICCDSSCEPKCNEEEIDEQCKSEWNEDCIKCVGTFGSCSHDYARIFTDAVTYTCSGGCEGDCVDKDPQPACSKVYKCKTSEYLLLQECAGPGYTPPSPLDCYPQTSFDIPFVCKRCTIDYANLVNTHPPPNPSKRCK